MIPIVINSKSYEVKYMCDKDGAEMISTGIVLTSNPPLYPHKCTQCGDIKNLSENYPLTRWQPVNRPYYY